MPLADNEFHDLISAGALVEQRRTSGLGQGQRHLSGTIDGVGVTVKLYESQYMVRAEIGAPFPFALGVGLEMVSSGASVPPGAVHNEATFDQLFHVIGVRDGQPVRNCLSPQTMDLAITILERFGGEVAVKEGGVLWTQSFGDETVDLRGNGSAIARSVARLAQLVWTEARTTDPTLANLPAPPLTGAPASPKTLMVFAAVSLVVTFLCLPLAAGLYYWERDLWIFFGAIGVICLPIGLFFSGFALWRWSKIRGSAVKAR